MMKKLTHNCGTVIEYNTEINLIAVQCQCGWWIDVRIKSK